MPLKLQAPRQGKTPYYSIRGTYLGIRVDKSSKTDRRSVAAAELKKLQGQIERGEYPPKQAAIGGEQPTFLTAANAYMDAGRRPKYVAALIKHFGETPLAEIDQDAIDRAAVAICPNTTPGTRNACVYTPLSAILHHAGLDIKVRRPKGAKGRVVTDWLSREDANAIILAAERFNPEFALLLRFLLYTGLRLNEVLRLKVDVIRHATIDADGRIQIWVSRSKGGHAGLAQLRRDLYDALVAHCQDKAPAARVFPFRQGGHLRHQRLRAVLGAQGIPCPAQRVVGWREPPHRLRFVNFHTFRHTWATWMRAFAKTDVQGLVATGNWRDARSAARYAHVVAREEWSRVELLPAIVEKKTA